MTQASTQGAGLLFSLAGVWLRLPQISELQMRQRRGGGGGCSPASGSKTSENSDFLSDSDIPEETSNNEIT